MNLKRKHAAEGRTRSRLKCQFGSSALDSATSPTCVESDQPDDLGESIADLDGADEDSTTPTMRLLATQLHRDALDDEDPPASDGEGEPSSRVNASDPAVLLPKKVRLFFGTQVPISLRDLFDYPPSARTKKHGFGYFQVIWIG